MNKKTLILLVFTVFLLIPILIVYGADKNVDTDDTIGLTESAGAHPKNPTPGDILSLDDDSGRHPRNPAPRGNTISLSGLIYYDGIYYHGGTVPGTYTPPTVIGSLLGFVLPLALILAVAGFSIALARNRTYRMVGGNYNI